MRLSIIRIVFLKELREMLRDRRSLTIMFGIPLVLYPLLTIVIGFVGVTKQKQLTATAVKVAVVNPQAAPHLIDLLNGKDAGVQVIQSADPDADLASAKLDAILVVPPGAEEAALARKEPEIVVRLDRSRTSSMYVEPRINKILNNYEHWVLEQRLKDRGQPTELLQPLKRTTADIATADQRLGKLLAMSLPVLLLVTGMLGALFPALNATTTERELGTLETLLVTPAGRMELLVAKGTLVLLTGLLTAGLNMFSMSLVLWRSLSLMETAMGSMTINIGSLLLTYLAAVPSLITFSTMVLIVGLLARNFREANSLATPIMMIPLASMIVAVAEPAMTPGLLVTPVANTTLIIREVLTGRITAGPFLLAFLSSCVYAGLFLSLAARVFTNEQLVNPSWEPVSIAGLKSARRRQRQWRLPGVDEALALFSIVLLLTFYIQPSLLRFGLVATLLISQILLLAGPAVLLAWVGKYRWVETFSWRKPAMAALIAGALLGVGLAPWMELVGTLQAKFWPPSPSQTEMLKFIIPPIERHPLMIPLLIGVLAGVCEEILFRGPIQTGLLRRLPKWPAICIAALLFAAAHLDLQGMPVRTFLGLVLGYLVVQTGSIFPAMAMHACYDITQLLVVSREIRKTGSLKLLESVAAPPNEGLHIGWLLIGAVMIAAAVVLLRRPRRDQDG